MSIGPRGDYISCGTPARRLLRFLSQFCWTIEGPTCSVSMHKGCCSGASRALVPPNSFCIILKSDLLKFVFVLDNHNAPWPAHWIISQVLLNERLVHVCNPGAAAAAAAAGNSCELSAGHSTLLCLTSTRPIVCMDHGLNINITVPQVYTCILA